MKIKKQLLIFTTLIILLMGAANATDITDDTTYTAPIAEETVQQTQIATDMDNIATQDNKKDVETDTNMGNNVTATQSIQKNTNKANTKEATPVMSWNQLTGLIKIAIVNTTFTLLGNMTNTETITLDNPDIVITIDGNGKTINGAQNQVFYINSGSTLILKNITITNATTAYGGAIHNNGTLTITNSTLTNNTANTNGGAIHNNGTLTITNSTLTNNTAYLGGAIYNNWGTLNIIHTTLNNNTANTNGGAIHNWGTLNITHTTLNNNTAKSVGGAINNHKGTINITHTTLNNNTATYNGGAIHNNDGNVTIFNSTLKYNEAGGNGGAIYNYKERRDIKFNVTETFFTQNHAGTAGAICSANDGINNIIKNNRFTKNTANNKETLVINGEKTLTGNAYDSTDINLKTVNLTLKYERESFDYDEEVMLNLKVELENPEYYDQDILKKLNKTLYINDKENITIKSDSHIISNLKPGTYSIYYTSCNQQSNTITFIIRPKQKDVYNYTQLIDAITEAKKEEYTLYTINLHPGNYNATDSIEWGNSATRNIIINGSGITLNGNNTHQFINITNKHNNLTLNNVTITNYTAYEGGAINNNGTLNITHTTLTNNTANYGGAIENNGTLNITHTTLQNNNANRNGGAIDNYGGTLNITHTTLQNNTANYGGAIWNYGTLSITDSTLNNNTANYGGAIHNILDKYFTVINSNFTKNHANYSGAIDSGGYANLTGNIFSENTATDNKETIDLWGYWNGKFKDNQYKSTDISLNRIELLLKDDKQTFMYGENIELNLTIEPENSIHYYHDISEAKIDKTIFINSEENVTTTSDTYTLSNLEHGIYFVYYSSCNQQSNTITFKVMGNSEITTSADSYDYYDGVKNTVTLNIRDPVEEKGTADILVKDGDKYQELIICHNVNDGYTISTKTLKEALENLYDELEDFYTINVTYSSEFALPSSTEFTLNIIKQRNTTITYDILNNTEGNVQINITVQNDIYKTPIPDATIKIIGDINQNATTGVITDTTLTPGDYTINIQYEENTDYKASTTTIYFTVEIDKDKKITELENNITNITTQLEEKQKELEESNKIINTLNETNKKLTEKLKEAKDQITALTNTITNLNNKIQTLNNTVNNLTNQLKEANNKINTLNNSNKELTEELENTAKKIETLNDKINNLTQQLTAANNEIDSLNNINNELTKELEEANKEIETLNNKINNLTKQLTEANNEINSLNNTNDELTEDLETANNKIQTLNNKINNLTKQLTEAINQMNSLTNKVNNLTNQLKEANKQINYKNYEIKTLNDTINSLTEQLNDAKEEIENLNKIIDKLINKKPLNTTITINPIKSSIGEIATLTANIIDQNGDKVTGGKAVFKVNGITLKDENNNVIYATVTDGTASISYKVPEVWMKNTSTIQAVYGGTEKYAEARTNATDVLDISIGKATIALEKDTLTAKAGQTITLKALVLDANSDRINTGKAVFKLNGKTLKDNNGETLYAQVKDGEATLNYTIPSIYSAKAYTLTAVYGGGNYERAETTGTLNLERKAVNINPDKITTKNNKTTIKATITDETGTLLVTSTKLAIKINQKTVLNNVTSTNGKIDVSFTLPLRPGMYELTIISGENALYKKGTMTTVLKI